MFIIKSEYLFVSNESEIQVAMRAIHGKLLDKIRMSANAIHWTDVVLMLGETHQTEDVEEVLF